MQSEDRVDAGATHRPQHRAYDVGMGQLAGAEVHRQAQVGRHAAALPVAQPAAGLPDDPGADVDDQPALLGNVKEGVRREQAALGMLPAEQRLGADQSPRREVDLRLVEEPQLAALEPALKLLLDRHGLDGALPHGRVEELGARAAALLGAVHRGVGVLDQALAVDLLPGLGEREADRRAQPELGPAGGDRLGDRALEAVRDADGLEHAAHGFAQDGELVATETRNGVLGSQRALEAARDLAQDLVAGRVTEAVVDSLEAVEVHEVDGGDARFGAAPERMVQPVGEERAVG